MEIVCPSCRHYYFNNQNIEPITVMIEPSKQIPVFVCTDCGTLFKPLDEAEESEWHEIRKTTKKQGEEM